MRQIKVYITAKREHAEKITKAIPDGFHCNSRWPYMLHTGERPVTHWLRENFDDAVASDFVIFYVEPGDNLKTSLIEVGHALAWGKRIFIASDRQLNESDECLLVPHKGLDPWMAFDEVKFTGNLKQTFAYIKNLVHGRNDREKFRGGNINSNVEGMWIK